MKCMYVMMAGYQVGQGPSMLAAYNVALLKTEKSHNAMQITKKNGKKREHSILLHNIFSTVNSRFSDCHRLIYVSIY